MGLTYLQGVALSASFAVLVTMAASVTLLPALLGFAGRKIDRLRIPGTARAAAPDPDTTPAARWSRAVQRRPWAAALAAAAVLLVLATPFLGLRLGFPDAGNDRAATTTRQAYDLVVEGLRRGRQRPAAAGGGAEGPVAIAATSTRWPRSCGASRGSPRSARPAVNPAGDTAVLIGDADHLAAVTADRGPDPPPARGRAAERRRAGQRGRDDRLVRRPGRRDRRPPAAVHRRRRDPVDPAADGDVPLGDGGA